MTFIDEDELKLLKFKSAWFDDYYEMLENCPIDLYMDTGSNMAYNSMKLKYLIDFYNTKKLKGWRKWV